MLRTTFEAPPARGMLVIGLGALLVALSLVWTSTAGAATLYVAKNGSDSGNDCSKQASPCATIAKGIGSMAGGDTLLVGDGTYAEPITGMPSGTASAYTTIQAENDWGVTIDGSSFANTYINGITVSSKHYVLVRGFHVKMNQANANNQPVLVPYSDHVKIQRCSGSYAPTTGNAASFTVGPASSYVLVEESYAFGGGRYQFLAYQSDHILVRRSVARNDYWNGTLQCAGFVNYNSTVTAWQNDIALDSDTANCSGHQYGGFFNENKSDVNTPTSQALQGNIVLNVQAYYAGDLDWVISGTRDIKDMVIWASSGGYWGDQGHGIPAVITIDRMTVGAITGKYDGANQGAAWGTGVSIYGPVQNTVIDSIFAHNASFGVADYTMSDYNSFFANAQNYGGVHTPTPGPHDRTDNVVPLKYLPRIEEGSPLKTAGMGGGQIGAEILFQIGGTGTLHDDPGWDQPATDPLWPFPNEDEIRNDMASYMGPGGVGARGFAKGNSLDGTPQTLTKYVWEYLGNQIPADVYGFHIAVGALPSGVVGTAYSAKVSVGGGIAPYTWKLTGALPPGLALDTKTGTISGTPSTAGTDSFTIAATDSESSPETASKQLSIDISPASEPGGDGGTSASGDGGGGGGKGCGCRVAGGSQGVASGGFLAMFALLALRRRR